MEILIKILSFCSVVGILLLLALILAFGVTYLVANMLLPIIRKENEAYEQAVNQMAEDEKTLKAENKELKDLLDISEKAVDGAHKAIDKAHIEFDTLRAERDKSLDKIERLKEEKAELVGVLESLKTKLKTGNFAIANFLEEIKQAIEKFAKHKEK